MKVRIIRKSITLSEFLSIRLDEISDSTGFSVSNLIQQGIAAYLYRFEHQREDEPKQSMEAWLERLGWGSGLYVPDDDDE